MDSDRDYLAEMGALINAALPDGDYVVGLVAHDVVKGLRADDPELLDGWLRARAEVIVTAYISDRVRSHRHTSREAASRTAFGEAAEGFTASGDYSALRRAAHVRIRPFDAEYPIDNGNLRRKVSEMTGADHLFVAEGYAMTRHTAMVLESFHRAVAKKVGDRRTEDVFTEDQYNDMYRSITGHAPPTA